MKSYTFETSCIDSTGEAIDEMRGHPDHREITYETMQRNCEGLLLWANSKGYEKRANIGSGLTLRSDPYVAYYKSVYRGQPCYYLVWSAIEWIWTLERCDPDRGNCYSVHADFLIDLKVTDPDQLKIWTLCHGNVDHPKMRGFRHGHCWLERTGPDFNHKGVSIPGLIMVLDLANGNHTEMPAVLYYYAGKIDPDAVVRYTAKEAFAKINETGDYGPWIEERKLAHG
jgi:hypothetical protein